MSIDRPEVFQSISGTISHILCSVTNVWCCSMNDQSIVGNDHCTFHVMACKMVLVYLQ